MAKDGVVSITIDYKNELNQMIRDYESALTEMASNDKLSKGMKSQFDSTIAELKRFKADMEKSFSDLSIGKVDKNSFKAFKQTVNKNFESVRAEIDNLNLAVSTINSQIKILGGDLDISKISNQFKDFQNYVQNTHNAVDSLIKDLDGQGVSLMSFDQSSINSAIDGVKKIEKAIKDLDSNSHEKYDITILDMNEEEIQNEANSISATIEHLRDRMDSLKKDMENPYIGGIQLTKIKGEYEALSLEMKKAYDKMEDILENGDLKFTPVFSKSALEIEELDEYDDDIEKFIERAKLAKQELQAIINSAKQPSAKISDKLNPNSAELVTGVTIETTSSELWKKLSPIIEDLQNDLNKNPVVAPVKLVVAPNAVSSDKKGEVGTISKSYSKKYQRELAKTGKDAVIDLEGVYKKTFTSIMDEAVSYSKETISKIQNIFESSPIKLYFDFNEEEFKKLSDALLSSDSGKKIDITGQIAESKKEVNELAEKLAEVNELLNSADSKDFSFKGFDKFTEEISKSLGQLTELQSMLKTLQNIESTLARASGVSSVTDIETQWQNVSKLIENSIKLDGAFRKNANVDKLASEYNKYLNMGGTNELSSIGKVGKLENSKNIIDAILSKVKELNSQKVDTSSVDKADDELKSVSSTLDDVISRLDHMINLTRDIGNTFWKMFKDASVSEVDKQWSSIESKFKSIADESGKINLSKQKKDIQELVEMYQKYANAGGMKTPFDLTDNTETIKKMNKVYEQMNSKKDGTSVGSESKEFSKIEGSVNSLTSAINTKTESIKTEANTMELAARAEVKSIQKIIDALNPLIEKIENIPKLRIPKEDTTFPSKESNISSGDSTVTSAIDDQNKLQEELKKTQKQAAETTDGIFTVFRGLKNSTDDFFDTKNQSAWFSSSLESAKSFAKYSNDNLYKASIKLNNPMIVDANGANHERILYAETNEELQEAIKLQDELNSKRKEFIDKYGKYLETQDMSFLDNPSEYLKAGDALDELELKFSKYLKTTEELQKIAKDNGYDGLIIKNVDDNFLSSDHNIGTSYAVFDKELILSTELLKEQEVQAEKTSQAVKEVSSTASQNQTKDAFPNADTKPETEGMKQVEKATEEAIQAKKDFATANEGVQSSIDESENPLKLEAELMEQIAKSAREAADAKKEFVEANKQVKDSADNSNSGMSKDDAEKQKVTYQELSDTIKRYSKVSERVAKGKSLDGDIDEITRLKEKISNLQKEPILSATQIQESERQLTKLHDKISDIEKQIAKTNQQKVDSDLLGIRDNAVKKLSTYINANKWTPEFIGRVSSKITEIGHLDITRPEDVARLKAIDSEIKEIADASQDLTNKLIKQGSKISDIISQMKIFRSQNTNMSSSQKQNLDSIIDYAEELKNAGKVTAQEIEKIKISFSGLKADVTSTGNMGKNFFSQIGSRLTDMNSKFVAQFLSWQDWIRYIQQGINTVRELDTALTEMRKVSDESLQSLKNYQNTTFDVADAVGTTAKQIQTSTADYMRLGESLDEAAESAKTANVLLNVSEFDDIEDATKSLVAMGQAYKDLGKMTIVDKLNEVGNNYAISTDELATALQKSSATLSLMGNTIDEAASLVTTANATIQDADSVSAGLRTISLRLVGTEEAEEELSAMNEEVDAFVKATNSKKQQIIKDYTAVASNNYQGFDILDNNGNYKNTYQILLGIAKIYKEIQEQDKKLGTNHATALIEELAGKNRSNIASAILQDPTQLEAVKKSSEEAMGSAQKELNSYLDSIDGRQICHVA